MEKKRPSNNVIGCFAGIIYIIIAVLISVLVPESLRETLAFVVMFVGLVALFLFWHHLSKKTIKALPQMEAPVKVLSKAFSNSVAATGKTRRPNAGTTHFYVSFLFPDGSRKNVDVCIDVYNTIMENETGILTYKLQPEKFVKVRGEIIFVNFKPDTNDLP